MPSGTPKPAILLTTWFVVAGGCVSGQPVFRPEGGILPGPFGGR